MFFSLIIGSDLATGRWRSALTDHAAWLNLRVHVDTFALTSHDALSIGRLRRPTVPDERQAAIANLVVTKGRGVCSTEQVLEEMLLEGEPSGVRLLIDKRRGDITAVIPPATPEPLYVWETSGGVVLVDDLRLIARLTAIEIDPSAVYALFLYGVVPAPLALFKGVWRCPPGSIVRIGGTSRETSVEPIVLRRDHRESLVEARDGTNWLLRTLQHALAAVPENAQLYFSGGVDSSLLAVQLQRMGRHDVSLINFSFGPNDAQAEHALHVASALGLPLHRITHGEQDMAVVFERVGRDYSYPFGDASVLPSNILAHATTGSSDRPTAVIEGTGADGAFAVPCRYGVWHRAYQVPRLLRSWAGESYRQLELWRSATSASRWGEAARQSVRLRLAEAAVAQNGLEGIAYTTPAASAARIARALEDCADARLPDAPAPARLAMLDQVLICAGAMAPKTFDPLRTRGVLPIYPYLWPAIVYGASLLPHEMKCAGGESKALLKSALARHLPAALVYRPKSGFTPPHQRLFAGDTLQQFMHDVVLSDKNRLLEYCDAGVVRSMIDAAARGRLAVSACDFLCTLTFASAWLTQISRAFESDVVPSPNPSCAASPA